jgi:HPt (histidine-containing phosphotransfer) domain-containing protein
MIRIKTREMENFIRTVEHPGLRTLNIDLDLYTEGDPDFKKELVKLIIKNVREFQQSLSDAVSKNAPDIFLKAAHKIKVSIAMLNDKEFTETAREMERIMIVDNNVSNFTEKQSNFNSLCEGIILGLESELAIS